MSWLAAAGPSLSAGHHQSEADRKRVESGLAAADGRHLRGFSLIFLCSLLHVATF